MSYKGVKSFYSQYKKPFDSDAVALNIAKKRLREKGISTSSRSAQVAIEEEKLAVLAEWKQTGINGNIAHEFIQHRQMKLHPNSEFGGYVKLEEGQELSEIETNKVRRNMHYYEKQVVDNDAKIIGYIDHLYVDEKGYIHVEDYKGLDIETDILTTHGFKKLKDLSTEDIIFDGSGNPTKIKNISEVHYNPCYKLTFDTNDTVIADHEHRWLISRRKYKNSYVENIYTTEELLLLPSSERRISCTKIESPEINLPIDPYILGYWLGDGTSQSGSITSMNPKVWEEIQKKGFSLGEDISYGKSGKAETRTIFGLFTLLKKLDLINNKHLPDIYLLASFDQKLELLKGFMDADGHFHKTRKRCVMTTTKDWQKSAIMSIVSSLGWKPTLFETNGSGFNKSNIKVYQICFNPIHNPFLSRNENISLEEDKKYTKFRYIKKIEKIETIPTKCIEVESKTHSYLFGRNFIKTHNTHKDLTIGYTYEKNGIRFIENYYPPVSHLVDCKFTDANLQLSFYMYMLWKSNKRLKPGKILITHIVLDENGKRTGEEITREAPYLIDEVKALIRDHKKKVKDGLSI